MKTWNEFFNYTKDIEEKRVKGMYFEIFCFYFLQEYLKNIASIWLYKDVPSAVKNQLELNKNDCGSDIIIQCQEEHHENAKFIAVQCKFLSNPQKCYTKTELSTFHMNASQLQQGILISTQAKHSFIPRTKNCVIQQIILPDIELFQQKYPVLMDFILHSTFSHLTITIIPSTRKIEPKTQKEIRKPKTQPKKEKTWWQIGLEIGVPLAINYLNKT